MPNYEDVRTQLLGETVQLDNYEDRIAALKALESLNKAEAAQIHPEPPEEKGAKAWFERHSDALIRVGGTFGSIVLIGFVENKFDTIFRSKASKYL